MAYFYWLVCIGSGVLVHISLLRCSRSIPFSPKHHYRRYTRSALLALVLGFTGGERSEDSVPPPLLNALLRWQFVKLATQRAVRFPAGVGLLMVLRRR